MPRVSLFAVALLQFFSLAELAGQEVNPGRVRGEIRFVNPSAALLSRCTSDPPTAWGTPSVFLRAFTGPNPESRASYAATAGTNCILATVDMNPNVPDTGGNFQISTESMRFQSGNSYRFGSTLLGGPGAVPCFGVPPLTADPAGKICDQAECAVPIKVRFRFVGIGIPALDTSIGAPDASCSVMSIVAESVNSRSAQAESSTRNVTISDLTNGGGEIDLIVRGNTEAYLAVSCNAPIRSGQTGFVMVPQTNLGIFSVARSVTFACSTSGAPAGEVIVSFDIPVERTAGSIRGLFDLTGYDEERPSVTLETFGSIFVAEPVVNSTNPSGPMTWQLSGVPSGLTPVSASTLAQGRDKFVIFPWKDDLNGGVPIVAGAVVDLGATFVSDPAELRGEVTLFDRGEGYLSTLRLGPFSQAEAIGEKSTSHAEARGNPLLPQTLGASGFGGVSRARLRGSYDTSQEKAVLGYELLLPGLGTPTSNANGTEALNTPWDFAEYYLKLQPIPTTYEFLSIRPGTLLHIDTRVQPSSSAPPHVYCFGRANLRIVVDPAQGALYFPQVSLGSNGVFSLDEGTTPVQSLSAYVSQPEPFAARASSVSLPMSLVSGAGYWVYPTVQFSPAGATSELQSTWVTAPTVFVPQTGTVPCAGIVEQCLTATSSGVTSTLSVDILEATGVETPDYCISQSEANFTIKVTSQNPARVAYEVDPTASDCSSASQVLCDGNCNVNATFTTNLTSLSVGAHALRVCASDTKGCHVAPTYSFEISNAPVELTCPDPIEVIANRTETFVPRSDPRLAGLVATVSGVCGTPAAISDDAPINFPVGATTTVSFTSPGIGTCSTPVTIVVKEPHLGGRTSFDGTDVLEIHRTTNPIATLVKRVSIGSPFEYAFSPDGNRVAIIASDGSTGVVDLTGGDFLSLPMSNRFATSTRPPHLIAWHRSGLSYAIVGREPVTRPAFRFQLYRAVVGAPPSQGQNRLLNFPPGFDPTSVSLSGMAYSRVADRIVIAGSGSVPPRFLNLAYAASTDPSGRITGTIQNGFTLPTAAADREEVVDVAFNHADNALIASSRGIYALRFSDARWSRRLTRRILDAMFSSGLHTAYTEDASSGFRATLANLMIATPTVGPVFTPGVPKGEVALSGESKRIAVVAQQGVIVYDETFAAASLIPYRVAGLRFRPGT